MSDFGTVREDVRGRKNSGLPTGADNLKSHGVTDTIIGTTAYMPVEYMTQVRMQVQLPYVDWNRVVNRMGRDMSEILF